MNVTLSSAAQTALDAILRNGRDSATAQSRLATGLKVATAADGPAAFFTARGLNNRANDFSSRLDGIQQGLKTIETASGALDGIEKVVEQMRGLANQARGTADATVRRQLAADFNNLRTQITNLVTDASYNGTNLVRTSATNFTVSFSEASTSNFQVRGVTASLTGLGLSALASTANWALATPSSFASAIGADITRAETALSRIRRYQTSFATATGVLTTRNSFTENLISTLRSGANQLTVANLDEEGAKLASLNTRSQLAQTTLGLAIQREQGILRLL